MSQQGLQEELMAVNDKSMIVTCLRPRKRRSSARTQKI